MCILKTQKKIHIFFSFFKKKSIARVKSTSGKVNLYAAIGYVPTRDRLQFGMNIFIWLRSGLLNILLVGNDEDTLEKAVVISSDIPDVAAVQNLWLYLTVC